MNKRTVIVSLLGISLLLGAFSIYVGLRIGNSSPNSNIVVVDTNQQPIEPTTETIVPTDASAAAGSRVCGESCNSDTDCSNPFLPFNQNAIQCISGQCQNVNCPGSTEFGVACNCTNATRSCGEKCGGLLLPLCGDGKSKCGYIKTVNQCTTIADDYNLDSEEWSTYCIPLEPADGFVRDVCSAGAPNESLRNSDRTAILSVEDLQVACADEPVAPASSVCGNGVVESGESCDAGSNNGNAGAQCNTSCNIPMCDNGVDDDGDGRIDSNDPSCHSDGDVSNPNSYDINRSEYDSLPATAIAGSDALSALFIVLGVLSFGICIALVTSKTPTNKVRFVVEQND